MENLTALASSSVLMIWLIPIGTVALTTLAGWIVERLVIRFVKGLTRHLQRRRESIVAVTMRGYITFWGLLVGLGLIHPTIGPHLPEALQVWYTQALLALFVISLSFMLSRVAVTLIRVTATSAARPVVSLISNVVWFITLAIGFLVVLPLFKIDIVPWLTAIGVAGLAVSLALQATLTDLISGMLLLGARQIAVGNYVKLSTGEEGYITDITWRTTTIRQLSNNEIIIPNAKMTTSSVTNYHTPQMKGSVIIDAGVSYASDLNFVERVTIEVGQEVMREVQGGVADFTPLVRFNRFAPYSVRFSVILQCEEFTDQYLIKSEFIRRLRARYRAEGINFPLPSQDVRLSDAGESESGPPSPAPSQIADGAERRG